MKSLLIALLIISLPLAITRKSKSRAAAGPAPQ